MRRFTYTEGSSNKFWSIDLQGAGFTLTFGRAGSKGRRLEKSFADEAAARKEHDKLVAEKLKKGYVEATQVAPPSSLRGSLEQALAENPDDLAAHSAYADLLMEQGDPRGEFIQVQLALEDAKRSHVERKALRARERELLRQHHRAWLGEATDLLLRHHESPEEAFNRLFDAGTQRLGGGAFHFVRGWLDAVVLSGFDTPLAQQLGLSPTLRLLRQLTIESTDYVDNGLPALAHWPGLDGVRRFQIGPYENCLCDGEGLLPAVAAMTRLEELYLYAHRAPTAEIFALPMPHLRKLHVYHVYDYPLDVLGRNPTLGNLEDLSCWPHGLEPGDDRRAYIQPWPFRAMCFSPHLKALTHLSLYLTDVGDDGARALVESGLLKRLRVLDLHNGRITDEGARALAACPDLTHLERLRLTWNNLTTGGVEALRRTGVRLDADGQYTDDAIEEGAHLYEGDIE